MSAPELGVGDASAPSGAPGCDPGPGMLPGRVPGRPVAPAPARASWGHSPPAAGHLCAPRPPSPSCPLGSPRAGGGNRRPRLDSASQAAAGSGGGAGRGGKQRTTRCVWASGARVSRSASRGAPVGGGAAGRRSGWNPRPEAAGGLGGPRGPSGSDGRQGRAAVGRACHSSRKAGPGAVPAWRPQRRAAGDPGTLRPSRETWLGRRAAPLAGSLPGVSGWAWRFFESRLPPGDPRLRKRWHFIQTVPIADFLKSYNFLFSFLAGPAFSLNKM